MLQPRMCSASRSETSTWIGPPGAFAMQSARKPSAGGTFGPPIAAWGADAREALRTFAKDRAADGEPSAVASVEEAIAGYRLGRMLLFGAIAVAIVAFVYLLVR